MFSQNIIDSIPNKQMPRTIFRFRIFWLLKSSRIILHIFWSVFVGSSSFWSANFFCRDFFLSLNRSSTHSPRFSISCSAYPNILDLHRNKVIPKRRIQIQQVTWRNVLRVALLSLLLHSTARTRGLAVRSTKVSFPCTIVERVRVRHLFQPAPHINKTPVGSVPKS